MPKNTGTNTPATTKTFRATRLKCVPAKAANKEALLTASMP